MKKIFIILFLIIMVFQVYVVAQEFTNDNWFTLDGCGADGSGRIGMANSVFSVLVNGNDLYVAGPFTGLTGNLPANDAPLNRIARWDGTKWHKFNDGAVSQVNCLALHNNNLYAGGGFDRIDTSVANMHRGIARWSFNDENWYPLDKNNDNPDSNGVLFKSNFNGYVNKILPVGDTLYIGGYFGGPGSGRYYASPYFIAYNTITDSFVLLRGWDAGLDTFAANSGLGNIVNDIIQHGDDLYIAGNFTATSATAYFPAHYIVRYNIPTGTYHHLTDTSVQAFDNRVTCLAIRGNYLYAGGWFTGMKQMNGTSYVGDVDHARYIAKYDLTTHTWSKLSPNFRGLNNWVYSMKIYDDNLYIGGAFQKIVDNNGVAVDSAVRIVKYNITNDTFVTMGDGVLSTVNSIDITADGTKLYAGGSFSQAGDKKARNIAGFYLVPPAEGDGSPSNPFKITNWEQLYNIRNYLGLGHANKHFKLMNNIDSTTFGYDNYASSAANGGSGWEPIGSNMNASAFQGTFDGDSKTIGDLYINRTGSDYSGLFGYVQNSTIKNVGLVNVICNGRTSVGGLAGVNYNGTITNSYVRGSVTSNTGNDIGGMVGFNWGGTITNSYAEVEVKGMQYIGGLVGLSSGTINNCYASGEIANYGSFRGGLLGKNDGGTISNCFAVGKVPAAASAGGLIGSSTNENITNSFFDKYTTGQSTSAGGPGVVGLYTANMVDSNIFVDSGWNFDTIWTISPNQSYPYFKWQQDNIKVATAYSIDSALSHINGGTITISADTQFAGGTVSISITTNPGYFFDSWTITPEYGVLSDTQNTQIIYTFTDKNVTITANLLSYFPAGDGSVADPFQITTWENLNNIRLYLGFDYSDSHFKLMNNLDSQTVGYDIYASQTANNDSGWLPIGTGNNETAFRGIFDGNFHTIRDFYIDRPGTQYVGLFGYIQHSTIKNVGVANFYCRGLDSVGGLIGVNSIGTVTNSFSSGITNGRNNIGGLVGLNTWGTVENSYASGQITGSNPAGGLVGRNQDGSITNSYSTGKVNGTVVAGGLVGSSNNNNITNSFFDIYFTGRPASDTGVGLVTINMVDSVVFADSGWNFTDTWTIIPNLSYPFLKWQISDTPFATEYSIDSALSHSGAGQITISADTQFAGGTVTISVTANVGFEFDSWTVSHNGEAFANANDSVTTFTIADTNVIITANFIPPFAGGDGSPGSPFEISSWRHLNNIRHYVGSDYSDSHFKLMSNLDSTTLGYDTYASANADGGNGWLPIGSGTGADAFHATFDGDSFTIGEFYINRLATNNVGLFGYVENSIIKNVGVIDFNCTGNSSVGGLVGTNKNGTILNCYSVGNVRGNNTYVGGLVGENRDNGVIINSYAVVKVTGNLGAGGLVGLNWNALITNSYAAGNVNGTEHVGGLIGYKWGGTTSNSYAKANVNGNTNIGGLIGNNNGTIINTYAVGKINGSSDIGGIVGTLGGTGFVHNSFYDIYTTGQSISAGGSGAVGLATIDMVDSDVYIDSGWNFTDTWTILQNQSYPFLKWQISDTPFATAYSIVSSANNTDFGSVIISADTQFAGGTVTVTSIANAGFEFDSWTLTPDSGIIADTSSAITEYTFEDTNVTITANFRYTGPEWNVNIETGSDTLYGGVGNETYPLKTITAAISKISSGDTIYIASGVYQEQVTITTDNISIIGSDSAGINATIIDLGDSTSGTNAKGILAQNKEGLLIKNIQIKNTRHGIEWNNVNNSRIDNINVNYNYNGINLIGSDSNIIVNNTANNNHNGFRTSMPASQFNIFENNVSSYSNADGFSISGGSSNNVFNNNKSYGNMRGFTFWYGSNNSTLINNISFENTNAGFYIQSDANILINNTSSNNSIYGFNLDDYMGTPASANKLMNNLSFNNEYGFSIFSNNSYFSQNTADSNSGYAFRISSGNSCTFVKNNIITSEINSDSAVFNATANTFDFTRNYWNTTDSSVISGLMHGVGANSIIWTPFRLGTVDTAVDADTIAPFAPDTVAAFTLNDTSILIQWSAVTLNEDGTPLTDLNGYRIYRSLSPSLNDWGTFVRQTDANTLSVIDYGLVDGLRYYYRVTAYDNNPIENESFYSGSIVNALAIQPDVMIHIPVSNYDTNVVEININGTAKHTAAGETIAIFVEDTLNGIIELGSDTVWSGTAQLTGIGNQIRVELYSIGNVYSNTITANYFEEPFVRIVSPAPATTYDTPYETRFDEILLSGTTGNTKSGDTISVYVDGGIESVADTTIYFIEGNWTLPTVSITDYLNTVVVQITDNWDRHHTDTIYIYSYPQPEIEIYSPVSGSNLLNPYDTNIQFVSISGAVRNIRNNDTILIKINNVSQSDSIIEISGLGLESDTTFSIEIKLEDFLNTVVANVYDGYGRHSDTTEFIYYYPQSAVEITNPLNNHDTGSQEIYITVKTDTSHIDDTVYIYLLSESVYVLQSISHLTDNNQIISGTTELNGINDTVMVVLENRFGDTVFTDVVINYYQLPNPLLLSPYNNHDTNVSYITVSGTVDSIPGDGNDTVTVYVNSIPADTLTAVTSDTGFWSIENVRLTGRNDTIYFSVVDSFGRTIISDYITVNYYTEPELKLTSPVSQTSLLLPYEIDTNIITLSGTTNQTRQGDTVYVYINGILQSETAVISEIDGNWTLPPVTINDNFNTVVIEIHDNWSRQNYDTFYVYYYLPPVIEILSPENFSDTTADEIIISGTVSNTRVGDMVYIIHNNDTIGVIVLSDNTWETSVRFTAYANRLTAIINDGFGRYNTDIINCTYQLRVPNLDDDIDTPFSIIQNAEDTIVITASDVTQSGTWVITADFGTLNNKITINRPQPDVITGSVSNYVRNEDTSAGMFIEIKAFDETDNIITDFTNHKISLSLNYAGLSINPENVKIFWLNENDSIWYDVMVPWQPGGAIAENFQNDTSNKVVSADLKHFSHYYVGEGWTDTVTVIIKEDLLSDTIYPDSFVTVTSVYILGDTVTVAGDTLTEFTIRNLGNIDGTKIDEMNLWRDVNNNGIYDDGDIFVSDLIWYADSGVWYNAGFDTYISLTGDTFVVTALFNDVMKRGDTFQAVIPAGGVNTEREYPGPVAARINNGILLADLLCEIFISSPETGIDTIVQIITLSGTKINADASDTIEILINGEHHYYYEIGDVLDDWSCTVELNVGSNLITVVLTSSDSTASAFITVNYLPLGYETDLKNAVIVPNPFRPNDGNEITGLFFTGSANDIYNRTGIHILKLTDNVKIEIYDILGRRVRTLSNIDGYGMSIWDGRDSKGNIVASGTYLFVISNDTQRVVRKVAIIK